MSDKEIVQQGRDIDFEEVELWKDEVNGAELLHEMRELIKTFTVVRPEFTRHIT